MLSVGSSEITEIEPRMEVLLIRNNVPFSLFYLILALNFSYPFYTLILYP